MAQESYLRTCVSWDTRKDSLQVNWSNDGCETQQKGENHTVCLCNHPTYFTVLVDLKPRSVCQPLELTAIRYVGCAVSMISGFALIIYLGRKKGLENKKCCLLTSCSTLHPT
ncbi:adhesion G-protein coupled receptor G5 [Oreochromis niloticus]|uniref:adhesion G-protein coupled receptor G5 n=1 Tax=Oreochromis niloticus TaxID=8128 RepID=UPI000904739E|nr:adhesion G-protein coupled receptor G5 [Oreochromis niloticus]